MKSRRRRRLPADARQASPRCGGGRHRAAEVRGLLRLPRSPPDIADGAAPKAIVKSHVTGPRFRLKARGRWSGSAAEPPFPVNVEAKASLKLVSPAHRPAPRTCWPARRSAVTALHRSRLCRRRGDAARGGRRSRGQQRSTHFQVWSLHDVVRLGAVKSERPDADQTVYFVRRLAPWKPGEIYDPGQGRQAGTAVDRRQRL